MVDFWLKDESAGSEDIREPEELIREAIGETEAVLDSLRDITISLTNSKKGE
jgi:hypothetical protein